jgi:hypothetical protein
MTGIVEALAVDLLVAAILAPIVTAAMHWFDPGVARWMLRQDGRTLAAIAASGTDTARRRGLPGLFWRNLARCFVLVLIVAIVMDVVQWAAKAWGAAS